MTKIDFKKFLMTNTKRFDIIFADPPYNFLLNEYIEMINLIKEGEILKENGEIIIEHSSKIL